MERYFRSRGVTPFPTSPAYWAGKWLEWGQRDPAYFLQRLSMADEFGGGWSGGSPPGAGAWNGQGLIFRDRTPEGRALGGNVFSDPATTGWEALLRRFVSGASQPYTPPDYLKILENLRAEALKLRQPGYSPAESELIQTQALDPLTEQRDAVKRQVIERFGARGILPGSGPVEQALGEVDRAFGQLATRSRSQFATQAIERDVGRRQQATQLDLLLGQLEREQQMTNEGRLWQAVQAMFQLPQLADARLAAARGGLLNPMAALFPLLQYILGRQQG